MEVIFQRTKWHVLVNQDPVMAICTEANKIDKIWVAQPAHHQRKGKKLSIILLR